MTEVHGRSVIRETQNGISILTLNCPEQSNKLNIPVMRELTDALLAADHDLACRVVVLTGKGEYFCGGGDLGDYRTQSSVAIRQFGEAFIELHMTIVKLSKPVIAAVQGHALGGGLNLVETCDLAVAAEDAEFGLPEMRFGIAPMMALTGLNRVASRKGVMEMALLAETVSAQKARSMGLINWVCAKDSVLTSAVTIAQKLTTGNPVAIALCKRLYYEADALNYQKQLENGLHMLVALLKSDDAAEAMAARQENRLPVWSAK